MLYLYALCPPVQTEHGQAENQRAQSDRANEIGVGASIALAQAACKCGAGRRLFVLQRPNDLVCQVLCVATQRPGSANEAADEASNMDGASNMDEAADMEDERDLDNLDNLDDVDAETPRARSKDQASKENEGDRIVQSTDQVVRAAGFECFRVVAVVRTNALVTDALFGDVLLSDGGLLALVELRPRETAGSGWPFADSDKSRSYARAPLAFVALPQNAPSTPSSATVWIL